MSAASPPLAGVNGVHSDADELQLLHSGAGEAVSVSELNGLLTPHAYDAAHAHAHSPSSSSSSPSSSLIGHRLMPRGWVVLIVALSLLVGLLSLSAVVVQRSDVQRWQAEVRRLLAETAAPLLAGPAPPPSPLRPPQGLSPGPEDLQCDCSIAHSSDDATSPCSSVCVFYYYFPQWHLTPENNRAHSWGFTDWRLLRDVMDRDPDIKALADDDLFDHRMLQQPGEMGYYSALNREVRRRQGQLAWQYGARGFIYHMYYFHRYPLFEEFFRLLLTDGQPALPFFFNWANEDWRMPGDFQFRMCHVDEERRRVFWEWLRPFLLDPRYLRVHNRPVLSVYRWTNSSECDALWTHLRRYASEESDTENGFSDLFITRVLAHFPLDGEMVVSTPRPSPHVHGVMEFLPNFAQDWGSREGAMRKIDIDRQYTVHWRGVPANWDNRPRSHTPPTQPQPQRWRTAAFHQSLTLLSLAVWLCVVRDVWSGLKGGRYELHPYFFDRHLRLSLSKTMDDPHPAGVPNIIAINAWNEWSEGSVMEPSRQMQRRMIEKVQRCTLRDYRGIFAVQLAVYMADVLSGHLRALLSVALQALDQAMATTPPAAATCHMEGGCLLFDYELLVFLRDSPSDVGNLTAVRTLLTRMRHPRLRFIDVPHFNASSGLTPPSAHLIPERVVQAAFNGSRWVHNPDWLLLLHSVSNATQLQLLSNLSDAAVGRLLSVHPEVIRWELGSHSVYRADWVDVDWRSYIDQQAHFIYSGPW